MAGPNAVAGASVAGDGETAILPDGPQADVLITKKLSPAELGHTIGRQFDSTDYYWEEMSTSDYEWALANFRDDVYAAVEQFTEGVTDPQQADQMARDYLNAIGLGSLVRVNTPVTDLDEPIVITARTYHRPTSYIPTLWMDDDAFGSLDLGPIYDLLDAGAQTVTVDPDVELTEANRQALDRLNLIKGRVTDYLEALPSNGVFMTPKGPITVAELRALWALTDFHITAEGTSYQANGITGFPGAGAAHHNNGNPVFETSIKHLRDFMASEMRGLSYILHELVHVTSVGNQYFLEIRPPGGPEPSPMDFSANERFANDLARLIADAMGHPFHADFDINYWDFSPDPQMTFVPNPGDGGEDGGGPGGGGGSVNEN